jgi:hypothetical protein
MKMMRMTYEIVCGWCAASHPNGGWCSPWISKDGSDRYQPSCSSIRPPTGNRWIIEQRQVHIFLC